jgi:hypothetical protein
VPQDLHGHARVDIKAPRGGCSRRRHGRHSRALARLASGAGRLARKAKTRGRRTRGSHGAAADLARGPSRRPSSGKRGQARSQPNPRRAYGPPPLAKSAAPPARD